MAEQSEGEDHQPVLKVIRHEYLGQSKLGPGTVRERPLPESLKAELAKGGSSCDKKHFQLNSSKGSMGPESTCKLRSVQLLRRAKIRKPVKTTGESDAKIRMPPPKFPPPRFIKKKKPTSPKPTGAMLKPTLEPVEEIHSEDSRRKNHLNFVPFELPKVKLRTQSSSSSSSCTQVNVLKTESNLVDPTRPHDKSGVRVGRLVAARRRKQKIVKKLKPSVRVEESDEIVSGKRIRKLVDAWAQKLGSLAKKHECLQNTKPKAAVVTKNPITHPTKAQLKQTESPGKAAGCETRAKNRFLLGKHKSWVATYQRPNPVPSSAKAAEEDSSASSSVPIKTAVCSNPLVNHTIELLRYKREAEACSGVDLDVETLAAKIQSFPVIPDYVQKGELLLDNIPLSSEEARSILLKRLSVIVAHSGYTHVKLQPMELLADALFNFMTKMTERLKQITEREAAGLDHGFPDPVERVLVELGMGGVRGLEEYYQTKIVDYHRRMLDQCNFIRKQYSNMLQSKSAHLPNGTAAAAATFTPPPPPAAETQPTSTQLNTTSTDLIVESEQEAIPITVQTNGLDNSTVMIMLKETLSQHNVLRLNFEDAPAVSPGAQLKDTNSMKS